MHILVYFHTNQRKKIYKNITLGSRICNAIQVNKKIKVE